LASAGPLCEKKPERLEIRTFSKQNSDKARGRRRYREALEKPPEDELMASTIDEEMLKDLRRGWCFGSEEFRQGLLEKFESFSPSLSLREEKTRRDLQRNRMKNPVTSTFSKPASKKPILLGSKPLPASSLNS